MSEQRTMMVPGQGIVRPQAPTFDHKEYPKHMAHRDFQPGKVGPKAIVGGFERGIEYNLPGTAIRFPPQLVYTKAEEEYYIAQGYESKGKCDPDAFRRLVNNMPDPGEFRPIQMYPKWVNGVLCQNEADETVQLARLAAEKTAMESEQAAMKAGLGELPVQVETPPSQPVSQIAAPVSQVPVPSTFQVPSVAPAPDPNVVKFMESVTLQMAAMTKMITLMQGDIAAVKGAGAVPVPPAPTPNEKVLTRVEKMNLGKKKAAERRKAEAEAARQKLVEERTAPRKAPAKQVAAPPPAAPPRTTGNPDELERQMMEDRARSAELERRRQEEKAREAREGLAFLAPDEAA